MHERVFYNQHASRDNIFSKSHRQNMWKYIRQVLSKVLETKTLFKQYVFFIMELRSPTISLRMSKLVKRTFLSVLYRGFVLSSSLFNYTGVRWLKYLFVKKLCIYFYFIFYPRIKRKSNQIVVDIFVLVEINRAPIKYRWRWTGSRYKIA